MAHDSDHELASADQDAWVEIAQAVREQLRRRIADMPAMNPGELQSFANAYRDAQFFEEWAHAFDHEVELRKRRISLFD